MWRRLHCCFQVIHNVLEIERVPREEPLFLASGLTWSRLKVRRRVHQNKTSRMIGGAVRQGEANLQTRVVHVML